MGTWGSGNLDSDGALDEIAARSSTLVARLWECIKKQESWEADEPEHDVLFVDFETVFALEAAGLFHGSDLVNPEEVDPVCDKWLAGWLGRLLREAAGRDARVRSRATRRDRGDPRAFSRNLRKVQA